LGNVVDAVISLPIAVCLLSMGPKIEKFSRKKITAYNGRLRYARWDLRSVALVDPHTQLSLCPLYPRDKTANASGQRRALEAVPEQTPTAAPQTGGELPPLLRKLLADYAATGHPPAYLPKPASESQP
jgi:hypothetical protein